MKPLAWAPDGAEAGAEMRGGLKMLEVGTQLPAFSLRDAQRAKVTEDAFAGSIAVLAFYPMAFTGG